MDAHKEVEKLKKTQVELKMEWQNPITQLENSKKKPYE